MRDITTDFKDAISKDVLWSIKEFFVALELLKNNKYEVSFWENEENWATVIFDNRTIGYLWQKYPVFFVLEDFSKQIQFILKGCPYICFIESNNLDNEEFRLAYDQFVDILVYGVNYEKFSATDLWFQTNSI